MKNIEEIIKANKEFFDIEELPAEVWNNINTKLHHKKNAVAWKPFVAAASIMLFMSITWMVANKKLSERADYGAQNSLPAEIQEAQVQFSSLIEIKRNELNKYKNTNPELVSDFETQLHELQKNYAVLVPQLKDENKRDIVLLAVIENLQMQVEILNQQINIIQQLKNKQNDTEEIVPL